MQGRRDLWVMAGVAGPDRYPLRVMLWCRQVVSRLGQALHIGTAGLDLLGWGEGMDGEC